MLISARNAQSPTGNPVPSGVIKTISTFDKNLAGGFNIPPDFCVAHTQPRPTNGIFVAITFMNKMLAPSGRLAICTTASATC